MIERARTLTDADLEAIAEKVADVLERRRKADRAPVAAPEPTAEDYERMRRLLRRKGVRVRE